MRTLIELVDAAGAVVSSIAPAHVATYGDIAAHVGVSPRQAGRLVSLLPDDTPWWRVVRADGRPATCRDGAASDRLRHEGVPMRGNLVDLTRARYQFP